MNWRYKIFLCFIVIPGLYFSQALLARPLPVLSARAASQGLSLEYAEICEGVKKLSPQNPAIIFSISLGKVSCFTSFNPVSQKTHIYHNWYSRDKLTTKVKLSLKPPRWSTFSTIQLRESDIGPWRLEITGKNGNIFKVMRFSITE